MNACCFIEPLDVLTLRGNKLFGEAGSYGESQMPPQPSVIAGALRSALMTCKGIDFRAFANGTLMDEEFGNASQPGTGTFRITAFHLAQRMNGGKVAAIYPLPADLSVKVNEGERIACRLKPRHTALLSTSAATAHLAILAEAERGKPESRFWLNADGWRTHLSGQEIDPAKHLIATGNLWQTELRIGIGLDAPKRSVETGKLFTAQAISLHKREHVKKECGKTAMECGDIGFLAQIEGAELPNSLTLRLGGDGRAAQVSAVGDDALHEPNRKALDALCEHRRCRIILTSPGIFQRGWLPAGVTGDGRDLRFDLGGVKGRLVCAAVPRSEVVSGWDLAAGKPKPAQRVAATGSVYWLEDMDATPEQLCKLADHGLWEDSGDNSSRRVEGYNRFTFATYP